MTEAKLKFGDCDPQIEELAHELSNNGDIEFYPPNSARIRNDATLDDKRVEESLHIRKVGDKIVLTEEGYFERE